MGGQDLITPLSKQMTYSLLRLCSINSPHACRVHEHCLACGKLIELCLASALCHLFA